MSIIKKKKKEKKRNLEISKNTSQTEFSIVVKRHVKRKLLCVLSAHRRLSTPLAWQTYQTCVGFSHTKQSFNSLTPI